MGYSVSSKEETKMSVKHLEKCLMSLAIRKMKIKDSLRFHLTLGKMDKINKTNVVCIGERIEKGKLPIDTGNSNLYSHCEHWSGSSLGSYR